ncbi:hypothetical protein K490DRAFT_64602 [Saccharata proteae CBS 121410]|uniref:SigF-like NTF2-like domain-containing protein n=1 Tax=Saccharata proteae CBS 121410 TaxID=1314787 RepID=A0A9P4HV02_9PEZI|nr:hypothetical protein K490DRAFT_64602 [Saccharata proteae CBS 121410]
MEDPQRDIIPVIHLLTQSPPSVQRAAIERYFTPDASFTHPFCRTGSFSGSRFLIRAIYRWYKIMSPRVDLRVDSVAYDPTNLLLYVSIHQVFRLWPVPLYAAPVTLVTVLSLRRSSHPPPNPTAPKNGTHKTRYYIASQNDLYQTSEFIRFLCPPGFLFVWVWQFWATLFCLLGAVLLWPVTAFEEYVWERDGKTGEEVGKPLERRVGEKVGLEGVMGSG